MAYKARLQTCIVALFVFFPSSQGALYGRQVDPASLHLDAHAPQELLSKPYPHLELFPENIMKPYDAFDFPWLEAPAEILPSNFQYILKPFFLQNMPWLC